MIILGITGGIGSGKTTITNILVLLGIPVYIADIESKRLTDTSPVIKEKLITLFGDKLYKDGRLDKALLASHIFGNQDNLIKVNAIIHPEVKKDFHSWISKNNHEKILVIESAIMFESGFSNFVDKTVTIYSSLEDRVERSVKRDNSSREKVISRINSQMPDEEKVKLSDFVIVNDNKESLIEQVLSLLENIKNH